MELRVLRWWWLEMTGRIVGGKFLKYIEKVDLDQWEWETSSDCIIHVKKGRGWGVMQIHVQKQPARECQQLRMDLPLMRIGIAAGVKYSRFMLKERIWMIPYMPLMMLCSSTCKVNFGLLKALGTWSANYLALEHPGHLHYKDMIFVRVKFFRFGKRNKEIITQILNVQNVFCFIFFNMSLYNDLKLY